MKSDNLYKKAIKSWGKNAQISMVIEESSELITELGKLIKNLMKLTRCKNDRQYKTTKILVEGEIADVEIMLNQMHFIFDDEMINKIKKEKLERLKKRLKTGE